MLVEVLTSMRRHGIAAHDLGRGAPTCSTGSLRGLDDPPAAAGRRALRRGRAAGPAGAGGGAGTAVGLAPAGRGGRDAGPPARRCRAATRAGAAAGRHPALARRPRPAGDWPPCSTCIPSGVASGPATGSARCPADGWIVVMAGGTAHGIGMEAPTSAVRAAAGGRAGDRVAGGGRTGAQPVHDRRQEALVPGAAAHAGQPGLPASLGATAGDRRRGAGGAPADHRAGGPVVEV